MKWRDVNGQPLSEGDIVEDTSRKVIGKIIIRHGLPALLKWKQFDRKTMNYEPVEYKAPMEAYEIGIIERHTKLWWAMHRYTLDNVEIIAHSQPERRIRMPGTTYFDAPVPWA